MCFEPSDSDMSFDSGPPAKRLRGGGFIQTFPNPPAPSPTHKQPISTAFPFNQSQLTSAPAQPKVKIEDADTQDSESPRAGTGRAEASQRGAPQAASKDADPGTFTQNGVTHDGAPHGRAPATEDFQSPSHVPVELPPEWKTAMACASIHLNWPPNHLESAYAEIVSAKGDDITTFAYTEVQGPHINNKGAYARVVCLRGNPDFIASVSIARAKALATMRITCASVEHVVVRGSKGCPLWLDMDSGESA
ncbi:hypothetical protein MAPG_11687 [Magnaporthiopsis poae ATCC 64411]|uniref:Uncharacterized protein n=1 Tax=Magnaporthiopsis poae (strain ATCC 64411 / 73-15) TaxID=644358 RepID=A0A0C4EFX7_MAGP6|nr:hypothetical protein MAPG_11687 [Magnaporthiopsis poae ATCC 64411]